MFNLIVVATGLFVGSFADMNSCQKGIEAIYFKRLAPQPQYLSKSDLAEIRVVVKGIMETQREFICVAKKA